MKDFKRRITTISTVIPSKGYTVYCQSKEDGVQITSWSPSTSALGKPREVYNEWFEQASGCITKEKLNMVCIFPVAADYPNALISLIDSEVHFPYGDTSLLSRSIAQRWKQKAISSSTIINALLQLKIPLNHLSEAHRLIVLVLKHVWLPFGLVSISGTQMSRKLSMPKEKVETLLSWFCELKLIEHHWQKSLCINRTFLKHFTDYPVVKTYVVQYCKQLKIRTCSDYQAAKAFLTLRKYLLKLSHTYPVKEHEKRLQITKRFILDHHFKLKGRPKKDFEMLVLSDYQYDLFRVPQPHSKHSDSTLHPNEGKA
ncbi:hypothetical protein [Vibrio sp. ER1A]|uniref:hypothetical protein n=1 Tax=Vibrio sp. ER1A TaxID=1517681 RepID=UPI0004DD6B1D|nr:hypothetical protein [Vibrio sp. ER1A]KFA99693.1 hypothetical protein HW45_01895 [Vibrio sp. ER1A]